MFPSVEEGKIQSFLSYLELSGEVTEIVWRERLEFEGHLGGSVHIKTLPTIWNRLPVFGLLVDSARALEFVGVLFIERERKKWHWVSVYYPLVACSTVDKLVYLYEDVFELSKLTK
jgi:hypothetical protein